MLEKLRVNKFWVMMSLLAALGVLTFIKLIDNYFETEGLVLLDRPINDWIVGIRTPWLNRLMLLITLAGNGTMMVWGGLLATILLAEAKKRRYLKATLLSLMTGLMFTQISKMIIERPRPPIENALIEVSGYAFPSGHSYMSVVFYGLVSYFWFRHFKDRRIGTGLAIVGISMVLLIAISRIYLGVHWTTDVLGGLAASGSWLAVLVIYIEYRLRYFRQEYREFNRKLVWRGFWIFTMMWLAALAALYLQTAKTYQF